MKNRRFKISQSLKNNIMNVLERRGINYEISFQDGQYYITVPLSGMRFHKIVVRAKMELLEKEEGSEIPYIDSSEQDDQIVLFEVGSAYIVR